MKNIFGLLAVFGLGTMMANAAVTLDNFNSATTPIVDSYDFGYVEAGATAHAGTLWNSTYVIGQTFTTGDNPSGYELNSISFQSNQTITHSASTPLQFIARVGTVSGTNFTNVTTQMTVAGATNYTVTAGNWLTLVFDEPIALAPNTTYGAGVAFPERLEGSLSRA